MESSLMPRQHPEIPQDISDDDLRKLGLSPSSEWKVFEHTERPGEQFFLYSGWMVVRFEETNLQQYRVSTSPPSKIARN